MDCRESGVRIEMQHSKTSQAIIIAAIEVHRALGPGLLESVYEECMHYELVKQGIVVKRQVAVPVRYKDVELECGFRLDLVVDNLILVELKAVDS
jgi:GxxExxY protein